MLYPRISFEHAGSIGSNVTISPRLGTGEEGNSASRTIVTCYHHMLSNADLNT